MNVRPPLLAPALAWLAALALSGCAAKDSAGPQPAKFFKLEPTRLEVLVTEQAEIQAHRSTRIKSEMEGTATIIFLVEEGKVVEKGEKLVELDASALYERRANQGIALARAEAALVQTRKNLEITTKQVDSDNLAAKNELRIAELEQEKFLGRLLADGTREMGEREQQLQQATSEIKLAEENLKLAKDTMEWSQKLHDKGWITKNELERDQLGHQEREVRASVARNQLEILQRFTNVQRDLELGQKLREAQIKVEQTLAKGEATMAQATAEVKSAEAEHDLARERYENLEKQIRNATITAPTPGLVVYASEGGMRRSQSFVEEGAQVHERQTLIMLPDISRAIAEMKIHESFIEKVRVGQSARIKIDASDVVFTGRVRRVSPVADSGSRWGSSDIKLYKTEVEIDGENTILRPGMSAEVQVVIAVLENVLAVPVQAVRRQGAVPYVWLETSAGPIARQVELGASSYNFVQIVSGLAAGDVIHQAAPTGVKAPTFEQPEPAPAEAAAGTATPAQPVEASHGSEGPPPAPRPPEANAERGGAGAMARFQALFKEKYPALAERAEADRGAMFRDEEIRATIDGDDELRALRDQMMAEFRQRRGAGSGGGPGREPRNQQERGDGEQRPHGERRRDG
jgi:HlyD family secretion protein